MIETHIAYGRDIARWVPSLARLRMRVFREFPYLYDGSEAYEAQYLQTYTDCEDAMAVIYTDQGEPVGATTGLPMRAETDAFRAPLEAAGIDMQNLFYCGESVLLAPWRGRGLYRGFFEYREQHARSLGLSSACFCAVVRPDNHPLQPTDYQPLDAVWMHYGYRLLPDLCAYYDWKDIDRPDQSAHPMRYWMRSLND